MNDPQVRERETSPASPPAPGGPSRTARRWSWVRDPIRPSPEGLAVYEDVLASTPAPRVLVMGATPEVLDLCIRSGARDLVSMDQDPDTTDAMRHLARESWNDVRFERGSWTDLGETFAATPFDVVLSDGGPLYLHFPHAWERLLLAIRQVLSPGGAFATRLFALPEDVPPFASILEATQRGWRDAGASLDPDRLAREATALSVATRIGSCDAHGNFDREVVERNFERFRAALREVADRPALAPVVDAHFGDGKRACDASPLIAGPRAEPVGRLAERCGFTATIRELPDPVPVPGCYYVLVARRR